ncbi:MAG: CoA transferase [Bacillota bacterium]|nr:CoA transferase [Bacillota bacterium]MDW7683596.1 CoA transferase [Bacillota bacterium]
MPAKKLIPLQDALSVVRNGIKLGLGGGPLAMNPVAMAANVVLAGTNDLDLVVAPIGGFAADLMIAAGAARSVEFAQLGFEELGMAPSFRRSAQNGSIKTFDHT